MDLYSGHINKLIEELSNLQDKMKINFITKTLYEKQGGH